MGRFSFHLGAAFLQHDGPGVPNPHLWFVISEETSGEVVIANISSNHGGCDERCVLRRGDHPFVSHDSYVRFDRARIVAIEHLEKLAKAGLVVPKQDLDGEILKRLHASCAATKMLSIDIKGILRAQGIVK